MLPSFLTAALDSARDLQGRTLRELLRQALELEPGLAAVLCSVPAESSGSAPVVPAEKSAVMSAAVPTESRGSASADMQRKNGYWKALIRGGLQGLLYRYDCEKA